MKPFKKPTGFIQAAREAMPDIPFHLTGKEMLQKALRPRGQFDHKGMFGHGLLIAGSREMCGAAILSAQGCLKSGIGLLDLLVPVSSHTAVQGAVPQAMVRRGTDEAVFCGTGDMDLRKYTAVAIGPGLAKGERQRKGLEELLRSFPPQIPLIIDADALNLLADDPDLFSLLPPQSILTPHPGEFERLWNAFHPAVNPHGADPLAATLDRIGRGIRLVSEHPVHLVLKGAFSTLITPDSQCFVNPTGNPGMATGGSGDVLTGILLSLSAQGYPPADACRTGVFLHGLSGDCALAAGESYESLTACDLVSHLGEAFRQLEESR